MTTPDHAGIRARLAAVTAAGRNVAAALRAEAEMVTHAHADLTALLAERDDLAAENQRLSQWKAEASEVILGLQDLGKALGLPLGAQITGPKAVEKAQGLVAENQRLRDTIQAAKADAWAAGHTFGIAFPATAESVSNPYRTASGVPGE